MYVAHALFDLVIGGAQVPLNIVVRCHSASAVLCQMITTLTRVVLRLPLLTNLYSPFSENSYIVLIGNTLILMGFTPVPFEEFDSLEVTF